MTTLPMFFDPNQIAPTTGGGNNLPVSDDKGHVVVITGSEMQQTKDGTGTMLVLHLQVTEGPHRGAEGVYRLNIGNREAVAVQIALSQLSAICWSVGQLQAFQDVAVLYNRPFRVIVKLQSGEGGNKGYTEIARVLDVAGNRPGTQRQATAAPSMVPAAPVVLAAPVAAAPVPAAPAPAPAPAPAGFTVPTPTGNAASAPWAR